MSKEITFSRCFPTTHPRKGEPTMFVEQMLNVLGIDPFDNKYFDLLRSINKERTDDELHNFIGSLRVTDRDKFHTVRKGFRHSAGDNFKPRVWIDKPYKSNKIQFAPETTITKTYELEIDSDFDIFLGDINRTVKFEMTDSEKYILAQNDGLTVQDFKRWFAPYEIQFTGFEGQVILWSNNVKY